MIPIFQLLLKILELHKILYQNYDLYIYINYLLTDEYNLRSYIICYIILSVLFILVLNRTLAISFS